MAKKSQFLSKIRGFRDGNPQFLRHFCEKYVLISSIVSWVEVPNLFCFHLIIKYADEVDNAHHMSHDKERVRFTLTTTFFQSYQPNHTSFGSSDKCMNKSQWKMYLKFSSLVQRANRSFCWNQTVNFFVAYLQNKKEDRKWSN